MPQVITAVDPFDLPEWLGTGEVLWQADGSGQPRHLLQGHLGGSGHELACDLLAVDEAYPAAVCDEATRVRVHHAWRSNEVLVCDHGGRLTLALPGTRLGPEVAMDALARLAKAVGARPERYAVLLRVEDKTGG